MITCDECGGRATIDEALTHAAWCSRQGCGSEPMPPPKVPIFCDGCNAQATTREGLVHELDCPTANVVVLPRWLRPVGVTVSAIVGFQKTSLADLVELNFSPPRPFRPKGIMAFGAERGSILEAVHRGQEHFLEVVPGGFPLRFFAGWPWSSWRTLVDPIRVGELTEMLSPSLASDLRDFVARHPRLLHPLPTIDRGQVLTLRVRGEWDELALWGETFSSGG